MNRIENITSICIWLGEFIDVEITRGKEIEVTSFNKNNQEKREALEEFIRVYQLYDKTTVSLGADVWQ